MEGAMARACALFTDVDAQNAAHCARTCLKVMDQAAFKEAGNSVTVDVGKAWKKARDAMAVGHIIGKLTTAEVCVINQFEFDGDSGGCFQLAARQSCQQQDSGLLVAFGDVDDERKVGSFVVASKAAARGIANLEQCTMKSGNWAAFQVKKSAAAGAPKSEPIVVTTSMVMSYVGTFIEDLEAWKHDKEGCVPIAAAGKLKYDPNATSPFAIEWYEIKKRDAEPKLAPKSLYLNGSSPYQLSDVRGALKRGAWRVYKP